MDGPPERQIKHEWKIRDGPVPRMRRGQFCRGIVGITLLFATPLCTPQTSTTTFTSSSELVLIPTVVNDKSGSHISGLKKDEFVLKQDGKNYPIAVFEEVRTSSVRIHRSEGEHGTFSNYEPGSGGPLS